jgi:hypothetical protein
MNQCIYESEDVVIFNANKGAKEVTRPKGNKVGPKGLEIGRMGCEGPSQGHNNKHAHYHLQEC